jgi:hypothetical protein
VSLLAAAFMVGLLVIVPVVAVYRDVRSGRPDPAFHSLDR